MLVEMVPEAVKGMEEKETAEAVVEMAEAVVEMAEAARLERVRGCGMIWGMRRR